MIRKLHNHPLIQAKHRPGFALIATISVMVLLVMIALAMLSLSTIELRSARQGDAMVKARANARLALMLAIGELQKSAGADQRVTALAGINPANTTQPHLLGVWKSFKQSNTNTGAINYSTQKDGDFIQWLSSTTSANRISPTYPTQNPANPVKLVDTGTVSDPLDPSNSSNYISASAIDVAAATRETGKYAWHVFDESQKANLTINQATPTTDAERIASLGTGGKPGFQIDAAYEDLENLNEVDRGKLISLDSTELVSFEPITNSAFHYLTAGSNSLLVDVANGGYQKDLSLLFENTTLPADYTDRYIYSDSDSPVAPSPPRFTGAEPMPSPDPKWSLLHSHHNLYKNVSADGGAYGIDASYVERDTATEYFNKQQLLPVVSNAQFIFSMAPQKHSLNAPYVGFLGFWVDVVITLWNPYNVELRMDAMEFEFYRFPLQVEFFREDASGVRSASSGNPVHIAYMFNRGNNPTGVSNIQDKLPYRARISGPDSTPGVNDIVLKPGEYKVFGAPKGTIYNHKNWNFTRGLELEEGYNPQKGGVFERYISTNQNYQSQCQWPGPGNRQQIQVKYGDTYSVEVSPAKVNRTTSLWPETNNKEIVSYLKIYRGDGGSNTNVSDMDAYEITLNQNRKQVGAIELDLPGNPVDWTNIPSYGRSDMSQLTVTPENNLPQGNATEKVPFLIASLRLKTEQDSDAINSSSSSMWLHNGITNQYFTNGLSGDQSENEKTHQYEFTWEPMTSWNDIPTVEVDTRNRGYGGAGVTSGSGVNFAPFQQIPLTPATSIAQFSHAPLNSGGQVPLTTQIVGNSFASPSVPLALTSTGGSLGNHLDHSYMANTTLFDGYFLSTATAQTQAIYGAAARPLSEVINEFFDQTKSLPNPNFKPATNTAPTVTAADYETFAQHLYNKGAFNVNSTSVEAWALFLASGTNEALPILDMLTASTRFSTARASDDASYSRFAPMIGDQVDATTDDQNRWKGHRRLTAGQITTLARNVVAEVKARGPFQSVAEFVNRRLDSNPATGNSGTLQSAIDNSNLNTDFGQAAPKNNTELTSGNLTGNSSDGSVTQITQADLLNRLAPSITVRGDTFLIRTYGEATIGNHTTRVWCEALVQRGHDFVDKSQAPTTDSAALNSTNKTYGRRFNIVSFRWLSEPEI
ncbi:MAG: hypothetical protein QNL01_01865 [Akkermansiaceae bacterium]